MSQLVLVLIFVVGLVVGSFLNVVRHRLPRKEDLVFSRSRCPNCGAPIKWYDNIPIVSFIVLKRRCRSCGWKIPFVYPVIEAATGVFFVLIWQRFQPNAAVAYSIMAGILIACAGIDYELGIIPDKLTLPGILLGVVFSITLLLDVIQSNPLLHSLLGILVGGGSLFLIGTLYKITRHVEGMGFGDVKLMAMVGAFLGYRLALMTILIGAIAGAIVGIILVAKTSKGLKSSLPFGVFLSPAALLSLLAGERLLNAYLGLIR